MAPSCLGVRCRRLITASIAWETAPVTACSLAWRAGASIRLPRGPRFVTGLARCSHGVSGAGSFGDDSPRTALPLGTGLTCSPKGTPLAPWLSSGIVEERHYGAP